MKRFCHSIPIILIFTILLLPLEAGENWKRVVNKNGISVYTRAMEGSDIDEFKGIAVINARIEVIGEVLLDIPAYTSWVADCKAARIIKKYSDEDLIVYNVTHAPWPVSDRDVILRSKVNKNYKSGNAVINFWALKKPLVPVNKDCVRMIKLKGNWILEILDSNRTRVTYAIKADPGGSIPSAIANFTSKNIPYKTLLGMKRMVKKSKYIQAAGKSKDKKNVEFYLNSLKK